ncbi:MAG: DUF3168 domain-containing protein [Pseudomonadota bacterium]
MSVFLHLPPGADSAVANALLSSIRSDGRVRDLFGDPARVFDQETTRALYPYAALESHESEDASFIGAQARLHRITLMTASRRGGISEAREMIDALAGAVDGVALAFEGQTLVYCYAVYSDVVRPPERDHFRGLLRLKVLTRATAPTSGGVA